MVLGAGFVALGVACGVGFAVLSKPLPEGTVDAAADERAREMIASVDGEAWERTGAVTWTMFGHEHLWDRERNLARVAWGGREVWIDLDNKEGVALKGGERLTDDARRKALDAAYAWWINDSFWLNPVVKAFDEGTTRGRIDRDGQTGVMVSYASGGLTPGDAYLWWLDENGRPTSWQLWVSVIPIGGLEISWEGWTELDSGAIVATKHGTALGAFELTDVAGAETLSELLPGPDPFAVLFE